MQRFQAFGQFVDAGHGRRYAAATISVFNAGTNVLASLYSDNASPPTAKQNPFIIDRSGYFFFYAPNGRYDVRFESAYPQVESPAVWPDIVLFDESDRITIHEISHASQLVNAGDTITLGASDFFPGGLAATDSVWVAENAFFIPTGLIFGGVVVQAPNLLGFVYKNPTGGGLTAPALTWKIARFRP